jgi:hypothetical protein
MKLQWERLGEAGWHAIYRDYRVEISAVATGESRVRVLVYSGEKQVVRRDLASVEEAKAWVEEMVAQAEARGTKQEQNADVTTILADASSENQVVGTVSESE